MKDGSTTASKPVRARRPRAEGGGRPAPRRGGGALPLLLLTLLALGAAYAGALVVLEPASPGQEVTLDRIIRASVCQAPSAAANAALQTYCAQPYDKVSTATFRDEDARITGTLAPAGGGGAVEYWTSYPRSDVATNDLLRNFVGGGVTVQVDSQPLKAVLRFLAQFLLPLVILANLFALLFVMSRGGAGGGASEYQLFGRVGEKRVRRAVKAQTTFADVAANEEAVAELAEVRDYLADPTAFRRLGALPPKGVLLTGPPGCGKTLLARAVAGEANARFFSISGSEFVESLVGVGAARVRDLFRQARANAPALIFIDELDAAGRQRGAGLGGGNDEREQTLNEMLVQMDGFSPRDGVVVIGATNRPDILDPALLRAGRFDRQITVERPDRQGRMAILRLHAAGRALADPAADLPYIAARSAGFTGADLANVLNEGALLAVREKANAIGRHHLEEAIERVLSGPRRRSRIITAEEKRRIAYHEAGHTVVAAALGRAAALDKVSIIARGRGVGHLALLQDDRTVHTQGDMEVQIAVAVAGVAAEVMVFGQPSTGSEQDLDRATNTARDMAGRYGMSERLGLVRVLREQREVFLGRDYLATKEVSQPTLEHLDEEVRRLLDEQLARARGILSEEHSALDALASALIVQETVQATELEALLREVRPRLAVARADPYRQTM